MEAGGGGGGTQPLSPLLNIPMTKTHIILSNMNVKNFNERSIKYLINNTCVQCWAINDFVPTPSFPFGCFAKYLGWYMYPLNHLVLLLVAPLRVSMDTRVYTLLKSL